MLFIATLPLAFWSTVVGVPSEGIAVILGVGRLLDMRRTILNVTGDITAALWVTRIEGRLSLPQG